MNIKVDRISLQLKNEFNLLVSAKRKQQGDRVNESPQDFLSYCKKRNKRRCRTLQDTEEA